jgi:hypothetical protein
LTTVTPIVLVLILTGAFGNGPLPSPHLILQLQESATRETYRAERGYNAQPPQPNPEPQFHSLTDAERRDLHEALERFFRENPGGIIDARTGKALAREQAGVGVER